MAQNTQSKNARKNIDKETISDETNILQTYGPNIIFTTNTSNKKLKNRDPNNISDSTINSSAMDVNNNISSPSHPLFSEPDIKSRETTECNNHEPMIVDPEKSPNTDTFSAPTGTNQIPPTGSTSQNHTDLQIEQVFYEDQDNTIAASNHFPLFTTRDSFLSGQTFNEIRLTFRKIFFIHSGDFNQIYLDTSHRIHLIVVNFTNKSVAEKYNNQKQRYLVLFLKSILPKTSKMQF